MKAVTILGNEFEIIEEYPECKKDNTVFVWKKGDYTQYPYYKAQCYFIDKYIGIGIGSDIKNSLHENKVTAVREAIYFAINEKLEDEVCDKIVSNI